MCLIIQKPADIQIPESVLITAWENNDDGMGIMTTRNNRVKVHRIIPETEDDVINLYNKFKDEEIGIHFRWATHGLVNKKMAHPFKIYHNEPQGEDLYMMHNGIFSRVGSWKQGASDTWHFVNEFLQPWLQKYTHEILKDAKFQEMLGSYVGSGNKLLFLDSEGTFTTINKTSGSEKDGYWISNTYSLTPAYRYPTKKDPIEDDYTYKYGSYYAGYNSKPKDPIHKFDDEISFAEFNSRELAERYNLDWDGHDTETGTNKAGDIILLPNQPDVVHLDAKKPNKIWQQNVKKINDNKVIEAKKSLKDVYDSTANYLSEGLYAGKTVEEIFYLDDKDFIAWFTRNLDIGVELLDDLLVYYMKETG